MSALEARVPNMAPGSLAALAEMVDRSVRVRWTPELEAAAAGAKVQRAMLEGGNVRLRVLGRSAHRVSWRSSGLRGEPCSFDAPHRLVLVAIEGEDRPRWIAEERIVGVVT